MRLTTGRIVSLTALAVAVVLGWALLSAGDARTEGATAPAVDYELLLGDAAAPFAAAGKGGPPKTACCDPALEPGVGGNPLCFEGHTCCSDGKWSCNNPDGTPSCKAGTVCDAGCGSRNDPCSVDGDCCSGTCKKNGRCA